MTWYILQSSNNQFAGIQFGLDSDKAVPADYTGDGRTDIAVWRPSEGNWYILRITRISRPELGQAAIYPDLPITMPTARRISRYTARPRGPTTFAGLMREDCCVSFGVGYRHPYSVRLRSVARESFSRSRQEPVCLSSFQKFFLHPRRSLWR